MPKTSARKKSSAARNGQRVATTTSKTITETSGAGVSRQQARPAAGTTTSVMSLIMPGMVALGCWGMAFTFTVFSTDPNRLLFGAMAALMALMWSVSFGIRARKVLRQK